MIVALSWGSLGFLSGMVGIKVSFLRLFYKLCISFWNITVCAKPLNYLSDPPYWEKKLKPPASMVTLLLLVCALGVLADCGTTVVWLSRPPITEYINNTAVTTFNIEANPAYRENFVGSFIGRWLFFAVASGLVFAGCSRVKRWVRFWWVPSLILPLWSFSPAVHNVVMLLTM